MDGMLFCSSAPPEKDKVETKRRPPDIIQTRLDNQAIMWLLGKPSRSDFSKITKGVDRQGICKGCTKVEIWLGLRSQPQQSKTTSGRLQFHTDFAELSECAKRCSTCCVFRRAIISACVTTEEAVLLPEATRGDPVYARIDTESTDPVIYLKIRGHPALTVPVHCGKAKSEFLNLSERSQNRSISAQIKKWLAECDQQHKQLCPALRWSSINPTRLIHIISESELQLCDGDGPRVPYVALSYSWGSTHLSDKEVALVRRGMTTHDNVESRYQSFAPDDLPLTLRDAITLTRRVGLSYAWIDSICIVQDDLDKSDFIREAPRMHEYYGNAEFTLAVCSNDKATTPMLAPRTAFSYPARPCTLDGRWLACHDVPLAEALKRSPLTKRAWTLQEQHLSPRVLFWTPNRMYWSCGQAHYYESPNLELQNMIDASETASQGFLLACNQGSTDRRHEEWLRLVTSYSLRDMSQPSDRFPALSGLASKYRSSSSTPNAYIAGLWETTIAHDLSWSVTRAASDYLRPKMDSVPSWSWASLPLQVGIRYALDGKLVPDFGLLHTVMPQKTGADAEAHDVVRTGALVSRIRVRGRLRRFWHDNAEFCSWSNITINQNTLGSHDTATWERPLFSFLDRPETSVFSTDVASGMIMSYQARKQEVFGQLDYSTHANRVADGLLTLHALQLTGQAILLLEDVGEDSFRRVGVAVNYRPDYFEDARTLELTLR